MLDILFTKEIFSNIFSFVVYETMFSKREDWQGLERSELLKYFNDCGHFPTHQQIDEVWDLVHRGKSFSFLFFFLLVSPPFFFLPCFPPLIFPMFLLLLSFSSVQFSRSVVSDSLGPHEPQHARPPCPLPTPRVHPNPCPLSQ